jgi:hypothetical protein
MKYLKCNGADLHEVDYSPRIETVTDDTTVDASWHNGILSIATDAKLITLADSCPIGMKLKVVNSGADGNNIVAIVGSSTVGIGGRNQVIAGTSSILTSVVNKELRNTKATSIQGDYVELTKISATAWDAVSYGIWAKEA